MTTINETAPMPANGTGTGGKGGRMAKAWQHVWDMLRASEPQDATVLAEAAAQATGLKAVSVISHLHRMANEGFIVGEVRTVEVPVTRKGTVFPAKRNRTFYRIKS